MNYMYGKEVGDMLSPYVGGVLPTYSIKQVCDAIKENCPRCVGTCGGCVRCSRIIDVVIETSGYLNRQTEQNK